MPLLPSFAITPCLLPCVHLPVCQPLFAVQKAVRRATGCPGTVVVARWLFEEVRSSSCGARFVRRRQSAGVGVGAFGGGSVDVEETRAARIRGADGTQGSLFFFSFSFLFIWVFVCVCVVRPRPAK